MTTNSKGNCEYCDRFVCSCIITEDDEREEALREAMNSLFKDPHYWSTRGCATCEKMTKLLKVDVGCVRFKKNKKER